MAGAWKKGDFQSGARKWQQNYAASGPQLKAGVAAPKRDPTQAAIAQQAALLSGFNAAVSSGQWAQGLQRAGQAGWQAGMNQYANSGLAQGAAKGASRVQAYASSAGPQVMAHVNTLPPRGAAGSNQARSQQMNDWMHQQRGKYRGAWRGGVSG